MPKADTGPAPGRFSHLIRTSMNLDSMRPHANCALLYHPDGFRIDRKGVMGRQSAGAGFVKGFIEHGGSDRLVALTGSRPHFDDFEALAGDLDAGNRPVVQAHPLDRRTLRSVGTVFLPGPGLERAAWNRRLGDERDYSLCGVTHTVATQRASREIGRYLVSPTQPWDALVCTSRAVREAVGRILARHAEFLARRGGGRFRCPVRLPVIPLGVDCDAYVHDAHGTAGGADRGARRAEERARLGIDPDDVAALFVGRLSFHGKAHPTPMYMAAGRAAERVRSGTLHLVLAGQFPNEGVEKEFRESAARFGGAARVHFVDGGDGPQGPAILAALEASDLFVSLSDNIQETFGLTPVEAMAAGLPCVVSDWNGYRDTVAEGETGFRVATTTAPPGTGIDLADRYAAGVDRYDRMIGVTSLATAVDLEACAEAIARLANHRELRLRLGAAGRARARRLYDWRVVVAAYQGLWAELAERRSAGDGVALRARAAESARPDCPDPFSIYRTYPTALLRPNTTVRATSEDPAGDLARLREGTLHSYVPRAFLTDVDTDALMARLASGPMRAGELAAAYPERGRNLVRTLLWLGKFGLVGFETDPPPE